MMDNHSVLLFLTSRRCAARNYYIVWAWQPTAARPTLYNSEMSRVAICNSEVSRVTICNSEMSRVAICNSEMSQKSICTSEMSQTSICNTEMPATSICNSKMLQAAICLQADAKLLLPSVQLPQAEQDWIYGWHDEQVIQE
jgi:hypothetical protein